MIQQTSLVILYIGATIGALIPDIDHVNSKISHHLKPLSKLINLLGIKHRGLTHSILGVLIFGFLTKKLVAINWITAGLYYSLLLGYISHLVADMFNPSGIPLLFPIKFRFKFGSNITTGGWQENIFFSTVIIGILFFFPKQANILAAL